MFKEYDIINIEMETLVIQSGALKGRKIPLPNPVHGHLHFTPAKFKKTVFSILESLYLSGKLSKKDSIFIDLFGGSGQMGFESLSRGFENVIIIELERKRFQSILEFSNILKLNLQLHNKDSFRFAKNLNFTDKVPIFYIDPPYTFWETQSSKLKELLNFCMSKNSVVFTQTPFNVQLENMECREIGNNLLWSYVNI